MASISASFVSVAPRATQTNKNTTKCASQTSVSSRAFSRGTSASFSGESVTCARLQMHGGRGQRRVTTMAAKVAGYIKLAIEAGKANPAPPIGPALGAKVRFPSLRFLLFPSSVNFLRVGRASRRRKPQKYIVPQREKKIYFTDFNNLAFKTTGCEHHGFLQRIQRENVGSTGDDHSSRNYRF
jgi:hypothetical protein